MATGELQFFSTIETLAPIVSDIVHELELECVLDVIKHSKTRTFGEYHKVEYTDIYKQCKKLKPYAILLSENKKIHKELVSGNEDSIVLGIVKIRDVPQIKNNKLSITDLCVKTAWYDDNGEWYENEGLMPLYRKIKSRVRKHLSFPVLIYDSKRKDKSEARIDKGVGYTPCVRELIKDGVELVQGAGYIRFCLDGPASNLSEKEKVKKKEIKKNIVSEKNVEKVTIDKSKRYWKSKDAVAIYEYLIAYSERNYKIHECYLVKCQCSGDIFSLDVDESEGFAKRICIKCKKEHYICDSEEYREDVKAKKLKCCNVSSFNIGVGFSLYDDTLEGEEGRDVRWIYIGIRCTKCGKLGSPSEWKIDYSPSYELTDMV